MNLLFMIEGGRALEMVKAHIAERERVREEVRLLAKELGVESVYTDRSSGVLMGAIFYGAPHPDFKKPTGRHGVSYPKKGSSWGKRLSAQNGYASPARSIPEEFNIPLQIAYEYDGGNGWRMLGNPLSECGFLHLGPDGPYAMWIPDVEAAVLDHESRGQIVRDPAKSFRPAFDGCRKIESEEWEILVLQHKLKVKQAASPDPSAQPG